MSVLSHARSRVCSRLSVYARRQRFLFALSKLANTYQAMLLERKLDVSFAVSVLRATTTIHANHPDVVKRVVQGEREFAAFSKGKNSVQLRFYSTKC